jgi:DNA cross-link repair 1A protein
MFRKPREDGPLGSGTAPKPSTGRPPTPPNGLPQERKPSPTMITRKSSTKTLTPKPNPNSQFTLLGRQGTKKVAYAKAQGKPNGSILNFFSKVDSPSKDASTLFLSHGREDIHNRPRIEHSPSPDIYNISETDDLFGEDGDTEPRYNERSGSVKKRRLSNGSWTRHDKNTNLAKNAVAEPLEAHMHSSASASTTTAATACTPPPLPEPRAIPNHKPRQIGGFLIDSDEEDEGIYARNTGTDNICNETQQAEYIQKLDLVSDTRPLSETAEIVETQPTDQNDIVGYTPIVPDLKSVLPLAACDHPTPVTRKSLIEDLADDIAFLPKSPLIPTLKKENTSLDDFGGFDDLEVFPEDDEFADGEEFVERKWIMEQARIEAAENGFPNGYLGDGFDDEAPEQTMVEDSVTASCPICEAKLDGLNDNQASRHVNACLDGNPIPLLAVAKTEPTKPKMMPPGAGTRFSRAAIARPGQPNPFVFGKSDTNQSSAFSKLMSSHAEDMAWATAAAAEQASRGKPAYQRTCPFYKIMPGFCICVDAFHYGAVQGCNAYFLSHFHSDHYIGLTSNWSHGAIYCSKITANLVKQQLRVDPKWVVSLEFESRTEIPGTQGVAVTMIPANHCPGSSLFLFEKMVGKGSNPKVQRVLHCGDFRACPAHIAHPLLMPDIVDSIAGKTKQQKIDVCYLDTTYLNPRYAFPSQEDVIKACADMCVSLKKEKAEESDTWEVIKKERACASMTKFIGATVKTEDSIAMDIGSTRPRGRLLVICGTYSIGKERICMGIARALDCKIWAPPGKQRICAALEDPELMARLTDDPKEAQIHMQMLMEIRADTLQDYLNGFKPHFSRIVGFRPSGWNYRPPNSR